MTVRLGLLAILDQGACYGYQLRTELDRRTGLTGPINVGQIYNTLDRLERDKLVRKTGEANYYEITALGSQAVATWFGSASPADDLADKIALASTLPGVDVAAILRVQRTAATNRANLLAAGADAGGEARSTAESLARRIVDASAVVSAESELAFLDRVERLVALGLPRLPLSADLPRRGRPPKPASVADSNG